MQRISNSHVATIRANILAKQKGKCAICSIDIIKEGKTAVLDHDHDTGVVRGVLCNLCNGLEGKIKNLATRAKREGTFYAWLENLLSYLTHHKTNRTGMLHPTHKTEEEKRVLRNKRQRLARAKKRTAPK